MTKDDIKKLCEADEILQWWAMILFAEICELIEVLPTTGATEMDCYRVIERKIKSFPDYVIQRALEKADEKGKE